MPDLVFPTKNSRPKDLLIQKIDEVKQARNVSKFLVLLQSSGKTVLELAKDRPVVYGMHLLCKDNAVGWKTPTVLNGFIEDMQQQTSEERCLQFSKSFLYTAQQFATSG